MSRSGDDPYDDVTVHKVPVIRPDVDLLIAEIVALGGKATLEEMYGLFYYQPPSFQHRLGSLKPMGAPDAMAAELTSLRDQLVLERTQGGWEVERLLEAARRDR